MGWIGGYAVAVLFYRMTAVAFFLFVIPEVFNRESIPSVVPTFLIENLSCGVSPPRDEALLFRQKCPKPFSPVRGPSDPAQKQALRGASASAPNKMARELALLKQPSPKSRFGAPAPPHPTRVTFKKSTPGASLIFEIFNKRIAHPPVGFLQFGFRPRA